jgi:aspartyl-tRNA(Asn)/glutamyl-tRNA(Gln) amidotransferase subunit B
MSLQLEVIIGLEVHAQVSTRTKMFCGCRNDSFDLPPNTAVCPVCMGHPGSLPVANREAVLKGARAALAIGCTVHEHSHFDRKHYFYPDLPSGFQISQYDEPLATHGSVTYDVPAADGASVVTKVCRIHRLHLENDAGKLSHAGRKTTCDYNRAGTPLMEIVTEPDLRNADEASAFASELRRILVAVGASDADMFKGEMRFDASISLREVGTEKLNPRSEIKNLNSFKALERALAYEERRLRQLWEETGGPLPGDITVGWMDDEGVTRVLRDKESAQDYRYFPEPDLPPLVFQAADLEAMRASLPLLPRQQREHYAELGLSPAEATLVLDDAELRTRFDAVHEVLKDGRRAAGLVLVQLLGFLHAQGKAVTAGPSAADLVMLAQAMVSGSISSNTAKAVLETMVTTGQAPQVIIAEQGLGQVSDDATLKKLVEEALAANPKALADFKAGKQAALGAIVGAVMKATKGQANPDKVQAILAGLVG